MMRSYHSKPMLILAIGFLLGLGAGVFLPHSPVHAVATDRFENYAICTVPVDSSLEAVCILDFLSGNLQAYVISPQKGVFTANYQKPILQDFTLGGNKNPRFLMVSGMARIVPRGGAVQRPISSVLYIAELTSGEVNAYGLVWDPRMGQANGLTQGTILPIDKAKFRLQGVRDPGAVINPGAK